MSFHFISTKTLSNTQRSLNKARENLESVFKMLEDNGINNDNFIIAGGYFTNEIFEGIYKESYYWPDEARDVDIFICNDSSESIYNKLSSNLIKQYDTKLCKTNENNYLTNIDKSVFGIGIDVQIINGCFYKDAMDVLNKFDLTLNMFGMNYTDTFYTNQGIYSIDAKALYHHSMNNPIKTLNRIGKYIHRGFLYEDGEYYLRQIDECIKSNAGYISDSIEKMNKKRYIEDSPKDPTFLTSKRTVEILKF